MIHYSIQNDNYNSTDYFHIDPDDGSILLKRSLDHETRSHHHFIVIATDDGLPTLSSSAHIWLKGLTRFVSTINASTFLLNSNDVL